MIEVLTITPALRARYRHVRLRALKENPEAFCATFARESALTDAEWTARAESLDGVSRVGFLAMESGEACGLLLCFRSAKDATQASLLSVWTAPESRRKGVSAALVQAAAEWAATQGAQRLQLEVISSNAAAIAFYGQQGFVRTGRAKPHGNDATLEEWEMVREL